MKTNLATLAREGLTGLLNLAWPPFCGICGKKLTTDREETLLACNDCLAGIKKNPPPYCKTCGRSLRGSTDNVETCWECRDRIFYYETTYCCFLYEAAAKEALHLLKYSGKIHLSRLFCGLTTQFLRENPACLEDLDAVLAVPLHNVRFREREFNQAHILTQAIAACFGIKDLSGCLKRISATRPQSELDKKERLGNIKGAFEAARGELIYKKNLLLVDDLFTTGATLNECAGVLKKAGAGKINCLTFARGA